MSEQFLPALLGADSVMVIEAAFGADLTDTDGSGWTWTDITADARHDPGIPVTVGRSDNVSQAGAAVFSTTLNNTAGDYTPGGPNDVGVVQNTPIRQTIIAGTFPSVTSAVRFQGYLDSANPVTDQSATVKGVTVTALGTFGRLSGQKKPLRSAMTRAINLSGPTAWWPMEDPAGAREASSSVAGVSSLSITLGAPAFGVTGPAGAAGAIDFGVSNTQLEADTLPRSSATSWRFEWSMIAPDDAGQLPISFYTTGQIWNIVIQCIGGNDINIHTQTVDGTTRDDAASASASDGLWHRMRFDVAASGSDTTYELTMDGTSILSVTLTGIGFGQPIVFKIGSSLGSGLTSGTRMAVTEAAIWQPYASPVTVDTMAANDGYTGETVDDRLTRLCGEQGIALDLRGTSTVAMGPQSPDTILNLLRECEAADHGVLYDGFGPGIGYQCRTERYNADAVLSLDMGADPPQVTTFAPVFDRQAVKNQYTVSRKGGGSATVERTDGTVGTDTIGVEDASVTVNVEDDDALPSHAGWLVLLGTAPGFRYPSIGLNMRGIPVKAADVLGLKIGDRITIQNPASKATDLPADNINLVVEGWTEMTTASTWQLALNTSPYRPNHVFILDTDELDDANVFLAL